MGGSASSGGAAWAVGTRGQRWAAACHQAWPRGRSARTAVRKGWRWAEKIDPDPLRRPRLFCSWSSGLQERSISLVLSSSSSNNGTSLARSSSTESAPVFAATAVDLGASSPDLLLLRSSPSPGSCRGNSADHDSSGG
ncbi:hypothetical protein [Oryza sativa Japonica Group]|uniref:Uncharacterized protein n=1 Tax=Oryza sativa subsp. japonica TaxID=39947 RepID=Q5VQI9_ORYSJ|nr:hypothetical protein [Oryza sativa Japonica Group]